MRPITKIYVHCSASTWGNFETIDSWHAERGFKVRVNGKDIHCGYHFIINNPFQTHEQWKNYTLNHHITSTTDGQIEFGRPVSVMGAHVKDDNSTSIGICCIGYDLTIHQYRSLVHLCADLVIKYSIPTSNVLGHCEWYDKNDKPREKSCPNFHMETLRKDIEMMVVFKKKM